MSEELDKLIAMAKNVKMTAEEQEEQRRSFAYGNARIENERITWDHIRKAAESIPKTK
jgi:Fic family protein